MRSGSRDSFSDMLQSGIKSTVAMFYPEDASHDCMIGNGTSAHAEDSPALMQDRLQAAFVAEAKARHDQVL
jgi:hypothetical protein